MLWLRTFDVNSVERRTVGLPRVLAPFREVAATLTPTPLP
jgi:hypothetical protein